MIGLTTPSQLGEPARQIMFFGSCRTSRPVEELAERDRIDTRRSIGTPNTYTAGEALQLAEVVLGDRRIPDDLLVYVFGPDPFVPAASLKKMVERGVDVCWVEVSARNQFKYRDTYIQLNMLGRLVVRPHGAALLPWFRALTRLGSVDQACVENALERMTQDGFVYDTDLVDLLSGARREVPSLDEMAADLESIRSRVGGRLIICGAMVPPDKRGALGDERRLLNEVLEPLAARIGAEFYDPSDLFIGRERTEVFDSGGADEYHFAPNFMLTAGEAMERRYRHSLEVV